MEHRARGQQPARARAPAQGVYDDFRFNDSRSDIRWANYRRRSCVEERAFLLYPSIVDERGWNKLAAQHGSQLNVTLVREFYANAHENFSEVYSRETMVPFTAEAINAYYEIRDPEGDEMATQEQEEGEPSIDEIVGAVATRDTVVPGPGEALPGFEYSQLTSHSRAWYNFICSRLIPRKHMTKMSMDRILLLYKIVTGRPVNPGKIIRQSICRALSQRSTVGLACGGLITSLCYRAGVPRLDDDEVLTFPIAITTGSLLRFEQHLAARERQFARARRHVAEIARVDAQQQAPPPPQADQEAGAHLLAQLHRLEEQRDADRAFFEEQRDADRAFFEEQRAVDRAFFEAHLRRLEEQRAADRAFFEGQRANDQAYFTEQMRVIGEMHERRHVESLRSLEEIKVSVQERRDQPLARGFSPPSSSD